MRKKLFIYIFILISLFMFNSSKVFASDVTCKYSLDGGEYKVVFKSDKIEIYFNDKLSKYSYSGGKITNVNDCPTRIKHNSNNAMSPDSSTAKDDKTTDEEMPTWLDATDKVSCGSIGSFSKSIPKTTSMIVTIIMIVAPVLLIIMGSIDFMKSVMAGKDDDIKKNQKAFFNRLISAVLVFLVIVLAKILVGAAANGVKNNIIDCVDCFISNKCN